MGVDNGLNNKIRIKTKSILYKIDTNVTNFLVSCQHNLNLKHIIKSKNITGNREKEREAKKEWNKYTKKYNSNWLRYYSYITGISDFRYIPDDLYYTKIDQHFNSRKYGWGVNDKNYYTLWFNDLKQPDILVRKINNVYYSNSFDLIDEERILEILTKENDIIIKPSVETGGSKGIVFWNQFDGLDDLKYKLSSEDNFVIQKIIIQHPALSNIHPSSINTLRIVTLLFEGKVYNLSSVLRMGIDGSRVDNASAGGITCGINEDGTLKKLAYSANGEKFLQHPQGFVFEGFQVPSYRESVDLVIKAQYKMSHFRMISWDIAINYDGSPILIEANLRNGQLNFHQYNNGPLFGELTEKVLLEIFN